MNLYRVLIVDDEQHVVDALTALLESQTDLTLDLYPANSGMQAIEIMERGKIDLLITDIQMPDMSGIELVDRVNQFWPICKTIFLTAYANFNYACEAIKKHVFSYILKTEDDEIIIGEIRKILQTIDDELFLKQAQREVRKQIKSVNRHLFFDLLNQSQWSQDEARLALDQLGFKQAADRLILLLGVIKDNVTLPFTHTRSGEKSAYTEKFVIVNNIMEHYLEEWLQQSVCEIDDAGHYIWLLQFKHQEMTISQLNDDSAGQRLSGMLEIIQSSCLTSASIELSFIVSAPIQSPAHLADAYQMIMSHLQLLNKNTEPYVFSHSSVGNQKQNGCTGLQLLPLKTCLADPDLMILLESGDRVKYRQYLDDLSDQRKYWDILVITLLSFANQKKLYEQPQFCAQYNELFHFWRFADWHEYKKKIRDLSEMIFSLMEAKNDELFNHMIEFIKKYISAHLAEDISLMQLAEVTGYNATYLSGFFHKQTGEQLNRYIVRQKLNLIRKLLANTHLSIEEVAEKAGFSSRSYFNHFLKKETGLTPSNYRLEILNSQL